ncbi:MAG: dihydrolipoyllysine-residue acetyltransferase, partial [Betaproteobacteria bacterium]|nr:dihydrolipoyllysine-residue acetyltransferase [Betaproteobacteria bacterium]
KIEAEQSLVTVESDKASMEIPSSAGGVVKELKVKLGDKVSEGSVLLLLEGEGEAAASAPAAAAPIATAPTATAPTAAAAASPAPAPATTAPRPDTAPLAVPTIEAERTVPTAAVAAQPLDVTPLNKPHASPSVRRFARELGVALAQVSGSGPAGRITQDDVQAFVKGVMQGSITPSGAKAAGQQGGSASSTGLGGLQLLPWPKVDFAKFGPVRSEPLSRIKKLSGPNLARNWAMIPHVTQFDEADITELEQFRKDTNAALEKQGVKVTMLAFVMKACVSVLKKMPAFNSSLDEAGENLIVKDYWNIGFAADTPQGLVVPVLKGVDQKGFAQIASETAELAKTARDGKLKPGDMQGATFTISSLGGVGGTAFTPIVNAPEVAILGLSKSEIKPRWDGKQFVPRLMLPLSLSYDHRVIDGAMAARFTTELAGLLADMRKALL